jgi:ribosomal protein S1
MENYIDLMKQVSELSDSALEGLEHVKQMLNAGNIKSALILSRDFTQAFYQMEKTCGLISKNQLSDELRNQTISLRESINVLVSAFEVSQYSRAQEVIQFNVLPAYKKWQSLLQGDFRPYILN